MTIAKTSTAAFLAGATTLAVSLPAIAEERTFDMDGFDRVAVSAGLSVEVEVGREFQVIAEADSRRVLNKLDIRVRGDKLVVTRDNDWSLLSLFAARRDATVRISLPDLTAIEATSGSDVFVTGTYGDSLRAEASSGADLDLDNVSASMLKLAASSGSELRAEGSCVEVDIDTSSGASIRADDLICEEIEAHASSGSDIRAHATQTAVASASSGGGVRISGTPANVEKNESSGGNVRVN